MSEADVAKKDFFISYTSADRAWAEWIAWYLEQENYSTIIQAWHFPPGSNFVHAMDQALKQALRVIAVLSPDYEKSQYANAEWMEAFRRDPLGKNRFLLPVRVKSCNAEGLLGPIVYIDLVGIDEQTARERLLRGVSHEQKSPINVQFPGGSAVPYKQPLFPGSSPQSSREIKRRQKERIQLDFSSEALERLDELKDRISADTRAETIRQALRLLEWLTSETAFDDTVTITNKKGDVTTRFKAALLYSDIYRSLDKR